MSVRVAVAGASGYAGGEVLRLLVGHPDVEVGAVCAHSRAGEPLGELHPHLRTLADRTLQPATPEVLADHDVVVLALPHGASADLADRLPPTTLVLDCGADHRLVSPTAWTEFYGTEHAGTWPYGLPELLLGWRAVGPLPKQRDRLIQVNRVAVPGCNVTAVTLALAPGAAAGLIETTDLVAVLANGVSGAGRALKPHLLASEILGAASPYAVGGTHRHIPEIDQNLRAAGAREVSLSFTPTLVPMARGILATVTAKVRPGVTEHDLRAAWERAYAEEPYVQVLPAGRWPTTAAVLGSNVASIGLTVDRHTGRLVTVTALDNLVKGTAGAAVQSMNLALGLPEHLGLSTTGLAP